MSAVQPLPARLAARTHRFVPDPWLIPAALLGIIPFLSLLRPGIANTSDGMVHVLRIVQVTELMKAGVLYPQWAPDFYFGYGYPFFLFYVPGAHILAALFALLGLGASRGLVAVQILSLLLYGVGAYLAARTLFEGLARPRIVSMAALGAAALYVFAPMRLTELFLQGNLSQLFALSLLPWALWSVVLAGRRASWRWAAVAGLFLAALLYAHHPAAFLAYPLLLVVGLAVALMNSERSGLRRVAPRRYAPVVAAYALALALTAPFWLPWLFESGYGSLGQMERGMFNAALNLVPADQLFSPSLVLDATSINPPRPMTLGFLQALLAALGTVAAAVMLARAHSSLERGRLGVLLTMAVLLALSLLLILPLAVPIWTTLPIAKFIAFPLRLLGPAGLFAAIVGAVPLLLLVGRRVTAVGLGLVLVLALANVAPYLFPSPDLWRPEPAGGVGLVDIGRHEVQDGWRATTSANEYLPRWVQDPNPPATLLSAYEAGVTPERLDRNTLPPGSQVQTVKAGELENVYRLALPEPATVTIQRFYYPGWQAWINGKPVPISPSSPYGLIQPDAPAGESEVRVAWGSTPPRTAGWVLFGAALLAAAWLVIRRAAQPKVVEPPEKTSGAWLWAVGLILVLAGLKAWWIEPNTQWLRVQSPVDAPVSMTHPLHIRFANGVELLGYDLSQAEVNQGGELRVRLYWRTHQPLTEELKSYLHLDLPVTQETLANVTKEHAGEMATKGWPLGFYVNDLFRLKVPADMPPARAYLDVGLVDEKGARVPRLDGGDYVQISPVVINGVGRPYSSREAKDAGFRLGDSVTLEAYDAAFLEADPASGRTNPEVRLKLYWRTASPLSTDYTVFVHLLKSGERLVQADGPVRSGALPTSAWTPGAIIEDTRTLTLPPGVSNDGLDILVGLYDAKSGQRLRATDRQGARLPDDAMRLPVAGAPTP